MNDVNPYHTARDAYTSGNLEQCVKILQTAAAGGDADCRTFLGTLFHEGTGVRKDVSRAIELYEQAAEQTNLNATFMLGRTYYLGRGVRKEKEKGIRYLKRAAFMNCTEAQAMLAQIYGKGLFKSKKSIDLSAAWLFVAAHEGHEEARQQFEQMGSPSEEAVALAHLWTAPCWQGIYWRISSAGRCCHLFGLLVRRSGMAAGHNALRRSGPGQKHAVAMLQWLEWGVLISGSTGLVHYPSFALSNLVSASGCPRLSHAATGCGSW